MRSGQALSGAASEGLRVSDLLFAAGLEPSPLASENILWLACGSMARGCAQLGKGMACVLCKLI